MENSATSHWTSIRRVVLGIAVIALVIPVLYLYVLLAASGPATAVAEIIPATRILVSLALASFLFGWVTITALSFPDSLEVPEPVVERCKYLRGVKAKVVGLAGVAVQMPGLGVWLLGRRQGSGNVGK